MKLDPAHIVFVSPGAGFGGHEIMTARWVCELATCDDVEVAILANQAAGFHERMMASNDGRVQVRPLPAEGSWLTRLRGLRQQLMSVRAQKDRTVIVMVSGWLTTNLLATFVARLFSRQVLVYVPIVDPYADCNIRLGRLKDLFVRWVVSRLPHGWVVITEEQARLFRRWAKPPGPIDTLPNTIDGRFVSTDARNDGAQDIAEPLQVLVLGRLESNQKGLDWLLEHLTTHADALSGKMQIHLVGDGPARADIERMLAQHPALHQVLRLSPWGASEQLYQTHDVLLVPSRYEGVPLVMLEAMAVGLPVVASLLPGTRPFLPDAQLFAPGNMVDAFDKIAALRQGALRQQAIEHGQKAFQAHASPTAFALAVQELTRRWHAR